MKSTRFDAALGRLLAGVECPLDVGGLGTVESVAFAFSEIAESLLPLSEALRVLSRADGDLEDALDEALSQLAHILYHIRASPYLHDRLLQPYLDDERVQE